MQPDGEIPRVRPPSAEPAATPQPPCWLFVWGLRIFALAVVALGLDAVATVVAGAPALPVTAPIGLAIAIIGLIAWIAYAIGYVDARANWSLIRPWYDPERARYFWAATFEALWPWRSRRVFVSR